MLFANKDVAIPLSMIAIVGSPTACAGVPIKFSDDRTKDMHKKIFLILKVSTTGYCLYSSHSPADQPWSVFNQNSFKGGGLPLSLY